jgi:hypothetical protein
MATCDSLECVQAQIRLQEAKNLILSLCDQIEQLRASAASFDALFKQFMNITTTMMILAAAVAAIPVLGLLWAAAFLILALLAVTTAVYFASKSAVINGQIRDLEKELVDARNAFTSAAAEVMANCPQECWGDLSQPTC